MSDLAVVIVSWNTRAFTLEAIRTLLDDVQRGGPYDTEIWVVDNASSDDSPAAIQAEFPHVKIIENAKNIGFGAANNVAIRAMGFGKSGIDENTLPRAVYLLNSDTQTRPNATSILFNALFSLPEAGVVGARLTYEDGSFQHSAFAFPGLSQLWIDLMPAPGTLYNRRMNGRYPRKLYEHPKPFRVGHTLGATMMIRREVIQKTGMFDEQFFMYAEEVDWSWRIQKAGWKIYCVPQAHVIHLEGQSTRQVRPDSIINLWQSRLRLYRKHYPMLKRQAARWLIGVGMRRKIRQARRAYALRRISAKERDTLISAYEQVMGL
ncbi:MAG: glycosyltransferase family 2 protein [Anaerolineae bacterium]|nr:MAG: glycosyltransferase family 2 protein [Anaerolineae bacterium]